MTMICRFKTTPMPDGKFHHACARATCTNEVITERERPPGMNCKGVPDTQRVFNFTVAAIGHLLRGCPTCTQEEIDARLAICKGCSLYKRVNDELGYCTHRSCGCSISDWRGYVSKLAWRDQHCPMRFWPGDYPIKSR